MRRDHRMCNDDVPRCEGWRHLANDIEKSVVVGNENLDVITHFGELGRRADEIWNRPRIAVPYENVKTARAKVFSNPASDDAEPEHSYVFPGSTRHMKWPVPVQAVNQPAAKTAPAQSRT